MLDEKDLLAIAQLMDMKLAQQKNEILQETTQMMEQQKTEILREAAVLMESYFDPKFQLLSEQITGQMQGKVSVEVVQDPDDRVTDLEDDVLQLKKAQ